MPLQLDRMAELDSALAAGALLLVPNYRSSDQLVDQVCYQRRRAQAGNVFARPAIRAIDLWFRELWDQLAELHAADILQWRVLEPLEEQLLWQQVIQRVSPELLLLNRNGTAAAISEASRLLQQWQLPLAELRKHLSASADPAAKDDREYASAWLQAFEQTCRRQHLLNFSGVLQQLLQFVEDGTLARLNLLPPAILRAGFDAPPPIYRALFAAMAAQGVAVSDFHFAASTPTQALQACAVPADECRAAADWAKAILRQDPHARIGIVTADSLLLKNDLERCFAQTFADDPHAYSTTLSGTLGDAPYVHAALASLSWLQDELDTLECCALLRSPWLLEAEAEQDARAELELRLRARQSLGVRAADLRELCMQEGKPWHSPVLGTALLDLQRLLLRQPRKQALYAWLQFFTTCWDTLLPRATLLQSGDRALIKAWEGLLKQAQQSSVLFGQHDLLEATALLARMAQASSLATTNNQAPVQLLTPVTAAGMHFTHLWCMQMTEALWPGEQLPHPYLPLALQREHGMPGADRGQQVQQSKALLQGLAQRTSHELVFSYAANSDDLPQRCATLLPAELTARVADGGTTLPGSLHPALGEFTAAPLEVLQDAAVVPLPATLALRGGSGILASQSACPFKSFAQYRLQARELPQPIYGLPAHALGECVHAALQVFWQRMQSHAALVATEQASLAQIVQQALAPALGRLARNYPTVLTPQLQALETRRLTDLLLAWLDVERQRGAFSVVATERELLWALPRLQLHLRLDRIDRHADGSIVIIDYKTGKRLAVRWEDERPASPQLLLYQLAAEADGTQPETSALLYAHVTVEEPAYEGIARDDSVFAGLGFVQHKSVTLPDWPALKQHWRRVVGMLADEFLQGYAAVQPARRDSCNHCHLSSLCRIAELRSGQDEPEDAA